MSFKVFSKNGQILSIEEAQVPLSSIEYTYGFGVYESLRVKDRKPLFLADHIERLLISADIIELEHSYKKETLEKCVTELVAAIETDTYNLKMLLIGAAKPENATLYITASNPLFPDKKWYRDGVFVTTSHFERAFPHAKSLNMLQSYLAYKKAKEQGAYDSLLINRHGHIVEGTRTNFFAIKDKTIYSAPDSEILLGVTRKNILNVARNNGYSVEIKNITLDDLSNYDGAFITSTSTKILPLRQIADFEYESIPESVKKLIKLFDEFLETKR